MSHSSLNQPRPVSYLLIHELVTDPWVNPAEVSEDQNNCPPEHNLIFFQPTESWAK